MIKLISIALTALYIGTVCCLAIRYADILRNTAAYNRISGYEKYKKSIWYWPAENDFGRADPPDKSRIVGIVWFVALCACLIIPAIIFKDLYPPEGSKVAFRGWGEVLIWITSAIIALSLCCYIPMHSKSSISVCFNLHYIFKGKRRAVAWRRITLYTLICVAALFPVYILSFFNIGYIDDTRIVYSPFFCLEEKVFCYDDIVMVEPEYSESGNLEHYYIYNSKGESMDVLIIDELNFEQLQNNAFDRFGIGHFTQANN